MARADVPARLIRGSHPWLEENKKNFVHKYLDPASRLGEVLFGLIMVLSMTLTAELAAINGRAAARALLLAAIGCNIAWGIIDAIMYVMNCMTHALRAGAAYEGGAARRQHADAALAKIIRDKVEPELESLAAPEDREVIYRFMLNYMQHAKENEDLRSRGRCLWWSGLLLAGLPVMPAGGGAVFNFLRCDPRPSRFKFAAAFDAVHRRIEMGVLRRSQSRL